METITTFLMIIHIAAGCIALLAGLGAILLRRKPQRHKVFGRIYFASMTVIFVTAIYLSLYRSSLFLLFISIFTFHASFTARRSLSLRELHLGQRPAFIDWLTEALHLLVQSGLIVFGIYAFRENYELGIICLLFGIAGFRTSLLNIKRLRGKVNTPNYWLIAHINGMLASYIGAITAFTVNNNRWLHLPDIVAWLGPSIILVPLVIYETSKLKKPKKSLL